MSTEQQTSTEARPREQARPSEVDETKPERTAGAKPRGDAADATTTPHRGSSRKVDPEELNPDDFE